MLTSSLVQSLKPRAVRTKFFFLRALNLSRFRIWCLEFWSFGFGSNFGSSTLLRTRFVLRVYLFYSLAYPSTSLRTCFAQEYSDPILFPQRKLAKLEIKSDLQKLCSYLGVLCAFRENTLIRIRYIPPRRQARKVRKITFELVKPLNFEPPRQRVSAA